MATKKKKLNWVDRLRAKVKSYFSAEKAAKKKSDFKTVRTSAIEDRLRKSGMTASEIAKLRGKPNNSKKKGDY